MAESTIITGQFVRISQVPASLGERILARIIDYFLLFIYILATSYILGKLNIHAFSGSTFFLLFLFRGIDPLMNLRDLLAPSSATDMIQLHNLRIPPVKVI